MALKELKVEVRTLEQITEIIAKNSQGQHEIQKVVIAAVDKLWQDTCNPSATLVLEDDKHIEVEPKDACKETLRQLVGQSGPYFATKRYKSWVGLSEGVYEIEGCPILAPVSWFKEPKQPTENISKILVFLLTFISIVQSAILILLLL